MPDQNYLRDVPAPVGIFRWLPPIVVFSVVVGFVALSWYAYRAGTQAMNGDLLVVEADKTPVKEKPVDAGGMQFPNQDKTIFDTFSANSKPAKVERVLPTPEEPVAPPADTAGLYSWVNEPSANKPDAGKPEQVIAPAYTNAPREQDVIEAVKKPMVAEPGPKEMKIADAQEPIVYAAPATPSANNAVTLPDGKSIVNAAALPVKPVIAAKPVDKATSAATAQMDAIVGFRDKTAGTGKVQLGAYRSEQEAHDAWNAIQKKHHDLLAAASPTIVKADLGEKGVYYRLRVGGFAGVAEAKALCGKLAASGQACIIPTGK